MPLFEITRYGIGNATYLEIAWTLIGVLGLYNLWLLFLAALGDRDFLKREGINGTRSIVAETSVYTIGAKVIAVFGYAVIGLVASSQAPLDPSRQYTPVGVVMTVMFLIGALALNLSAIRQRWARNRVLEIEAEREQRARQERRWDGVERREP